jgi:acetylornithine aminotransferase
MLGTTFGGNHLACAAALAVLEVIEKENLIQHVQQIGKYLMEALKEMQDLKNVRGSGLMIGFDVSESLKDLRKVLLMQYHVFTGEAKPNVIRLLPSMSITKVEIDSFLISLKEALTLLNKEKEMQVSDTTIA